MPIPKNYFSDLFALTFLIMSVAAILFAVDYFLGLAR